MEKDIPFLQGMSAKTFTATYMKGRSNYVCLNRLGRAEGSPILEGLEEVDYFEEVCDWARQTRKSVIALNSRTFRKVFPSGVTSMRDRKPAWARSVPTSIHASSHGCATARKEADIVVVNHHLFFADLALRNGNYGTVLPDYTAVILDEAT